MPPPTAVQPPSTVPKSAGKRVLVVDGYPDAAHSLALLIAVMGHQAKPCVSGFEAPYAADRFRPDVALIDLHSPGLDGPGVARAIRATPGLGGCLLVAMTEGRPGVGRPGPDGDFDHFLPKPVDPAELALLLAGL